MLQQQERRKETYNGMNRLMEEKQAKECNVIHIRRKKEMKQTFRRKTQKMGQRNETITK